MSDPAFSLDALYAAIEEHLRQALPTVRFVATCPDIRDRVALPAVFVEPVEFEPGQDIGTGETVLVLRFEARAIVGPELAYPIPDPPVENSDLHFPYRYSHQCSGTACRAAR